MAQLMSYEQMVEGAVVIADINLPFYAAGDFGWFERNLVFTERKDGSVYMGARSRDGIFSVRKMFGPDFGRRKVAEFILEITATTLAQDYVGIPVPTDDEEELGEEMAKLAKSILNQAMEQTNENSDYYFGQPYWEDYFND